MADQNPQHGRRQHFHRGRRGQERRGNERRPPGPSQATEQGGRGEHREHVDVEQIMREIRTRISQRHGIELSTQQIQELAARRLEAILDPRTVKPSLLEQIRRTASTPVDAPPAAENYSFEDSTLYDSTRGSLTFIRRLLNPLLKLFFNPNPLIAALNTQAKLNQAAATRDAERDRRQTEWNALHYEILQRLVLENARTSIEAQQLSMRVEALSAKVEFAERRARTIESTLHQARPAPRHVDSAPPMPSPQVVQQPREHVPGSPEAVTTAPTQQEGGTSTGEGGRRRRRRRRGRRPQGVTPEGAAIGGVVGTALPGPAGSFEGSDTSDADEADDDDGGPDVAGDEGDSVFIDASPGAEAAPTVAEAAPVETAPIVETATIPVEPPPPDIVTSETPRPAATEAQSTESVVADPSDQHKPADAFGD